MEKRKKILIGLIVVLIMVVLLNWPNASGLAAYGSNSNEDLPPHDDLLPPDKPKDVVIPDGQTGFPLKQGSKGTLVEQLQEIINFNDSAFGNTNGQYLTLDRVFGPKTAARVVAVFGSPVVTEAQFKLAVERRKSSIPYNSRLDDNFPLRRGSYGPKTEALNVALGTYTKGDYAKNFTAKTEAAVKAKIGFVSVDSTNYSKILNLKIPNWGWGI